MMFGGAVQLIATLLFWGSELTGRYTGLWAPLQTAMPTTYAHILLMLYTLFPFFFFGFLMTTYPRWMNGPVIPKGRYVPPFFLMTGGVVTIYVGLLHSAYLLGAGLMLYLLGYSAGLRALWRVYRTAPARDKSYESILNVALFAGWSGIAAFLLWLPSGNWYLVNYAKTIGIWWFLVPIALTVAHRMIPFFSSCVLPDYTAFQPKASLLLMLGCSVGHGVLELASASAWLWIVDAPFAGLALFHTLRWGFRRSFEVRLLAVLHVAFLWLGVALSLYTLQSFLALTGSAVTLGRAPLHALTIGCLASLTLAMATRVTLGHSGRALEMDRFTWLLFWGISATALIRISAALPFPGTIGNGSLNLVAAMAWLIFMAPWAMRYGVIYLRPRADGRPG